MKRSMQVAAAAITVACRISILDAQGLNGTSNNLVDGQLLHTGMRITPTAAPDSVFQTLNPDLAGLPDYLAGQAVTTALSPDARTLLVLTSGYNRMNSASGSRNPAWSNEYVFVYDVAGPAPIKQQVLQVPNTFNGIAWHPGGQAFYVAGGRDDTVHFYLKSGTTWTESLPALDLGNHPNQGGYYQPMAAGVAVNSTGDRLLAVNMLYDSVTVVDLAGRAVIGEVDLRPGVVDPTKTGTRGGTYPFWVVIKGADKAYVSSQRDREVVIVSLDGTPRVTGRIPVGGLPGKMILNAAQTLLFVAESNSDSVAIIDTASDIVLTRVITTGPPNVLAKAGTYKGSNPNGLALSPDERQLYVTNGGTNSLSVIDLQYSGGTARAQTTGLIPTGYYPNDVAISANGSTLWVVNGMSNTGPNPDACRNTLSIAPGSSNACNAANQYSWQLTKAGLLTIPVPSRSRIVHLTQQVAHNNRMVRTAEQVRNEQVMAAVRRGIRHVIYVVKENRTYDQVFGDLPVGNGDPSLAILSPFSPNHRKLAMDFVLMDNFHDSGTVSGDGWNWSTAGRATDYTQKTVPVNYAGRGFTYDWEGANRNVNVSLPGLSDRQAQNPAYPNDPNLLPGVADVAAPDSSEGEAGTGYLWDAALRAGLSIRNYGFFVANRPVPSSTFRTPFADGVKQSVPLNQALAPHTDEYFRGYDQSNADFWLYREWAREFDQFVAGNNLPNLMFVRFPHDHFGNFSTAIDGVNTVETQMADNDYAVGLLIEKVAKSKYRDDTLIFIVEDDAQNGGDHVDAHRSIALVVGPYVRQRTLVSTHYTTVSMIRTIVDVLGLSSPGLNDALAEPMAEIFETTPRPWSYTADVPPVLYATTLPVPPAAAANRRDSEARIAAAKLRIRNAEYWQRAMADQDFEVEDSLDSDRFNRALWIGLRGEDVPYPHVRHGKDLRKDRRRLLERYYAERR